MSEIPAPPLVDKPDVLQDVKIVADLALASKKRRQAFPGSMGSLVTKSDHNDTHSNSSAASLSVETSTWDPIPLPTNSNTKTSESNSNIYRWAVVAEHQRGFTLFSVSHYSCASLLPKDPPSFVICDLDGEKGSSVSGLEEFTLPTPMWIWISKYWMVDMGSDGRVDSDGWEYNWAFRDRGWRSKVGHFNRGGWVRRRRWVRLMMMPSRDLASFHQSLVVAASTQNARDDKSTDIDVVWRDQPSDWTRCLSAMRQCSSDGRKLEMWKTWLRDGKSRGQQFCLTPMERILRERGEDILISFMHPNSRLSFVNILMQSDLKDALDIHLVRKVKGEFGSYSLIMQGIPP